MFGASVPANLHFASDVNLEGIRELESVEECVGHDRRAAIVAPQFEELGDHLGTEDAAVLIRELDGPINTVGSLARFHSHVKFTYNSFQINFLLLYLKTFVILRETNLQDR